MKINRSKLIYICLNSALLCIIISNSTVADNKTTYRKYEKQLHRNLLQDYNINARPMQNTSVSVAYYFLGLKEFDDRNGHISISGSFWFLWMDQDLTWNSSEYNGIDLIHLQKDKIWTPTFTLYNPYYEIEEVGHNHPKELVSVYNSGHVNHSPGSVLDAVCQADVTYFPFDNQICHFNMTGWYYGIHELYFELENNGNVDIQNFHYAKNSMWDVQDINLSKSKELHTIYITIEINRKPLLYLVNIILPINFICLLNIFVFLLPSDSGERVGFSVTMLLSLAVFLTIVSDRLPESSNYSILGLILLLEFSMSGLILVSVILGLRCYHTDAKQPIPVCIKCLTCCLKRNLNETDYVVDWIDVSKWFDTRPMCFWLFMFIYVACILCYVLTYCKLI